MIQLLVCPASKRNLVQAVNHKVHWMYRRLSIPNNQGMVSAVTAVASAVTTVASAVTTVASAGTIVASAGRKVASAATLVGLAVRPGSL